MARGLRTLWWLRELLNPLRWGLFAWMLASHKLCRWLVPWALPCAALALAALATGVGWARSALAALGLIAALASIAWRQWEGKPTPRILALPVYVIAGNIAALHAWLLALRGARTAVWEPTRRGTTVEAA
jgi:hypothetical protein